MMPCVPDASQSLSVIIPQYGCWEQTLGCCNSLLRFHREPFEIVVVDDGSPGDQQRKLRRFLPASVRWLAQEHQGVTAAWNLGIEQAQGDILILLNNDVITLRPWLQQVQSLLVGNERLLIGACWQKLNVMKTLPQTVLRQAGCRQLLQGWCLGFSRRAAQAVGTFDSSLRLYWSDTDWQLRWSQHYGKAGLPFQILPAGALRHRGHVSTRRLQNRKQQWRRDRKIFLQKWTALCQEEIP